jgi:hypothetical protein
MPDPTIGMAAKVNHHSGASSKYSDLEDGYEPRTSFLWNSGRDLDGIKAFQQMIETLREEVFTADFTLSITILSAHSLKGRSR